MWFGKVGLLDFVILNFGLLEFYVNLEFWVEEISSNSMTLANENLTWYRILAYIIAQHFRTLASKNSVWACEGFPVGSSDKEAACQCRLEVTDTGSVPGLGTSPGVGHGNPLQYSCLKNLMKIKIQISGSKEGPEIIYFNQLPGDVGIPRWLTGKESAYQCRRHGFIP